MQADMALGGISQVSFASKMRRDNMRKTKRKKEEVEGKQQVTRTRGDRGSKC